jgi:hypothetical protein
VADIDIARHRWLQFNLPKFSVKARSGKSSDVLPPPHTSRILGKCDVEIGPHSFINTVIIEAQYANFHPPISGPARSSTGLSGYPSSFVTPELVNRVNEAAAINPHLSDLIQAVATGCATPDQLRSLGVLIQSIPPTSTPAPDAIRQPTLPNYGSSQNAASAIHSRADHEFDIVLEFREKSSTRWIFPRKPAICERIPSQSERNDDIRVTTVIHPQSESSQQEHVVTFRFTNPPQDLWELLQRWSGGEEDMQKNETALRDIVRLGDFKLLMHRVYLA